MDIPLLKDSFEKVVKKQKFACDKTCDIIDRMILELGQTKKALVEQDASVDTSQVLADLSASFRQFSPGNEISLLQKDMNAAMSKYGKVIEKSFCSDISKAWRDVEMDKSILNQVITHNLYREGEVSLADTFAEETGIGLSESLREPFLEMLKILEQIHARNYLPALTWAQAHRTALKTRSGNLDFEFRLHGLQFIRLLHEGNQQALVGYAKENFGEGPFRKSHMAAIQRFMGAILYRGRLAHSPYADLLGDDLHISTKDAFTKEYFNLRGWSQKCPLFVTLLAGAQALPSLIKLASLMATTKPDTWQNLKQLPIEIELGPGFQFHSIFACPVSREQSSPENPPMLMPCGHVLCKQSIQKLGKGNSRSFKCPYCPIETTAAMCKPIQF